MDDVFKRMQRLFDTAFTATGVKNATGEERKAAGEEWMAMYMLLPEEQKENWATFIIEEKHSEQRRD